MAARSQDHQQPRRPGAGAGAAIIMRNDDDDDDEASSQQLHDDARQQQSVVSNSTSDETAEEEEEEEDMGRLVDDSEVDLYAELYENYLHPLIQSLRENSVHDLRLTEDEVIPLLHIDGAIEEFHDALTQQSATNVRSVNINIEHHDDESGIIDDDGGDNNWEEIQDSEIQIFSRIGAALGSLPNLSEVKIRIYPTVPSSRAAATSILPSTRQITTLDLTLVPTIDTEAAEELTGRLLVDSLSGHPNLRVLSVQTAYESTASYFCSTMLPVLPQLKEVSILSKHIYQSRFLHPSAYFELFHHPSIQVVTIDQVTITEAGMQIIAEGLQSANSTTTQLCFMDCFFPTGGGAWLAGALANNNTLRKLLLSNSGIDESFFGSLEDCLSTNTTLQHLDFRGCLVQDTAIRDFESAFRGLARNRTLQTLVLPSLQWRLISLDVIRESLANNTGVRKLEIGGADFTGYAGDGLDDDVWCNVAPFLRSNRSLKELTVSSNALTSRSCIATAEALAYNTCLKSFLIRSNALFHGRQNNRNVFAASVLALGTNTSLESYAIEPICGMFSLRLDKENGAVLITALEGSYGLSSLFHGAREPRFVCPYQKITLDRILRLNAAGRRYLVHDPASREKGVEVLNLVKDDLDCLYIHLRENPSLCSR